MPDSVLVLSVEMSFLCATRASRGWTAAPSQHKLALPKKGMLAHEWGCYELMPENYGTSIFTLTQCSSFWAPERAVILIDSYILCMFALQLENKQQSFRLSGFLWRLMQNLDRFSRNTVANVTESIKNNNMRRYHGDMIWIFSAQWWGLAAEASK